QFSQGGFDGILNDGPCRHPLRILMPRGVGEENDLIASCPQQVIQPGGIVDGVLKRKQVSMVVLVDSDQHGETLSGEIPRTNSVFPRETFAVRWRFVRSARVQ